MSLKKMAAHYELMNVAKGFANVLSKIATTGSPTQKLDVTRGLSSNTVNYLNSIVRNFNTDINNQISGGANGELNDTYVSERAQAGKVTHIDWKATATVLNQDGQGSAKPQVLLLDFYINITASNPRPFALFLKNGPMGLSDTPPVEIIQNQLARDYSLSPEKTRVYINGMMAAGSATSEELHSAIEQRVASPIDKMEKTASRKYLEKLAKKKSLNKNGIGQEGGKQYQLDGSYVNILLKDPRYNNEKYINYLLNNKNVILTQQADYYLRQALNKLKPVQKTKPIKEPTPELVQIPDPTFKEQEAGKRTEERRVRIAQTRLKALGFYWGKLDGKFGPITTSAVKAFQNKYPDLENTGILDSKTYWKLMGGIPQHASTSKSVVENTESNTQPTAEDFARDYIARGDYAANDGDYQTSIKQYQLAFNHAPNGSEEKSKALNRIQDVKSQMIEFKM